MRAWHRERRARARRLSPYGYVASICAPAKETGYGALLDALADKMAGSLAK